MALHLKDSNREIERLERCVNDLVSILALHASWIDRTSSEIVQLLLDAILRLLPLDFAYARLKHQVGEPATEIVRFGESQDSTLPAKDICECMGRWFKEDLHMLPGSLRRTIGERDISLSLCPLGLQGESGFIVTGSHCAEFPSETEVFLLSLAVNQGTIWLREARLHSELKKLAAKLDHQLARRTAELAEANRVLRDEIAGHNRVEEALKARDINLRLILDSIPAPVALMRPDGQVQGVNQPTLRYFGKTLEDLKHWGTGDAVHPDDLRNAIDVWIKAIKTGQAYEVKERLRRFDGIYRWFEVRGFPLKDPDGRILNWCVLLTDIDDRQRAEEKLRRSEAFLAEAQRLSSTGSFSWRVETGEIVFSEQLCRIFGFDPTARVSLELVRSRFHPDDIPLMDEMVEQVKGRGDDFEYEHRLIMPDGSIKRIQVVGHRSRDGSSQLEYIGTTQDVTQRRLAEDALAKARSDLTNMTRVTSLGLMAASIAHEVNQPLFGIITNADSCLLMLSSDPPDVEGARETVRRTIRDGNRATDVIKRIRALFSKQDPIFELMDLNDATREVISLALSDLQRQRVALRLELSNDLPLVAADRVQLQQVIMNLVRNAADAMDNIDDRPRTLMIKTEKDEGDRVRLSVEDAGVGLDPEAGHRLFEAFYTTKSGGMGIGLSISRSIIEAHHGHLWATVNHGPGATFLFSIPCRAANLAADGKRATLPVGATLRMI